MFGVAGRAGRCRERIQDKAVQGPLPNGRPVAGEPRSVSLVTDRTLDESIAEWAVAAVGGDRLVSMTGLREGGAPWLMHYEASGGPGSAVLRVGAPGTTRTQALEVRGMALARAAGVPVPGVIAARADDTAALLLIEYVDGTSHQPVQPDPARLEMLGRIAARISAVDPGDADLPAVTHPIPDVDFKAMRARARPQALLAAAQERRRDHPDDPIGFVHGDRGAATPCGAAPSLPRSSTGTARPGRRTHRPRRTAIDAAMC